MLSCLLIYYWLYITAFVKILKHVWNPFNISISSGRCGNYFCTDVCFIFIGLQILIPSLKSSYKIPVAESENIVCLKLQEPFFQRPSWQIVLEHEDPRFLFMSQSQILLFAIWFCSALDKREKIGSKPMECTCVFFPSLWSYCLWLWRCEITYLPEKPLATSSVALISNSKPGTWFESVYAIAC